MLSSIRSQGPGLGVRYLGEVKKRSTQISSPCDAIFMRVTQIGVGTTRRASVRPVFLPVKSRGLVGDSSLRIRIVALRARETIDFMTARGAHLPYEG